jgi:hypothetical protein
LKIDKGAFETDKAEVFVETQVGAFPLAFSLKMEKSPGRVLAQTAFAQSTFVKTIRNSGYGGSVIETTDGGIAFTGVDYVRLDKKGSFDLIAVKLTVAGSVEWKKKINGAVANPLITQLFDESYVRADLLARVH